MSGPQRQRRILVLGLGNPDRGDDGIGAAVVAKLEGRLPTGVALRARSGDMLSLIEDWAGFEAVICVDAAAPMGEPGRIHRIDLARDEIPVGLTVPSSHAFGLAEAVALARALGCAPADIVAFAIEGLCFDGGAAMTPHVREASGEAAAQILAEISRLQHACGKADRHA